MEARRIDDIRHIVSRYAAQYGAKRVYLFGSHARGDANENSDVDLRIDKWCIRGLGLAGLLVDLEDGLQAPVDLIPTTSLTPEVLDAIRPHEVLLYEAE